MSAKTMRTTGPLHFEDLDPKRFEDLVRQLAYEFRVWRRLEATGRSGSDDGFDARGLEIAPTVEDETKEEATADSESPTSADRLWLIQCKREKTIGPTKLAKYLDDIRLQEGEALHGVVFAAACDFSKKAHDGFVDKCRSMGIQECYLWGKAAIEDLLYQPRNDHLLFAYFGFSLTIRRRTVQTTLRRDIATKKKLRSLREKDGLPVFAIRNADGDIYPELPSRGRAWEKNDWRLCPFREISRHGLIVECATYLAYVDGDHWDAADLHLLRRSHNYLCRQQPEPEEGEDEYREAAAVWDTFPETKKAWLYILGAIPYERILAIDDVGDEVFEGVHLFCRVDDFWPFSGTIGSIEPVDRFAGRRLYPEQGAPSRLEKFPPKFKRPKPAT